MVNPVAVQPFGILKSSYNYVEIVRYHMFFTDALIAIGFL